MINEALTPAKHYTERMNDGFWKHSVDIIDERGRPFQIILHHFTLPDQGLPHDHPFRITSQIVAGSYTEEVYEINKQGDCNELVCTVTEHRMPGSTNVIEAGTVHKIIDLPEGECWTIARYGPGEKKAGFYEFTEDEIRHRYWDQENFRTIAKEEDHGICMEKSCNKKAKVDYNGHGYWICNSCDESLNNYFDEEYK